MQKIIPCLWSDGWAEEAAELYTRLFPDSAIGEITRFTQEGVEHHGQSEGTVLTVSLTLAGQEFVILNGGPMFRPNPSISFFVLTPDEKLVDGLWKELGEGGSVMMPMDRYPWGEKYGWAADRFGVNWQIMKARPEDSEQTIVPALMFTGAMTGKAEEAMNRYGSVFGGLETIELSHYGKEAGDRAGMLNHGRFRMGGQVFVVFDSGVDHDFGFSPGVSLQVLTGDQAETDRIWNALRHVPEAERCGWLCDLYGMNWQIIPREMLGLLNGPDREAAGRARAAMFEMKKIDIAALKAAYGGGG
ncbi:VOC family protein [Glycocaulis sp.]